MLADALEWRHESMPLARLRQPRTTVYVRRAVFRAIEMRDEIPDCVARWWNKTKTVTVSFAFVEERPRDTTLLVALA
jgi:hypothetical protein